MEAEFTEKQARELVDMNERLNPKEERIKEMIESNNIKLFLGIGGLLAFFVAMDKLF